MASESPNAGPNEDSRILDMLPLGVCVVDADLRVLAWNQTLAEWTSIPASRACGANLGEQFPSVLSPRYLPRLRQVFEQGTPAVFSAAFHKNFLPVAARVAAGSQKMIQQVAVRRLPGETPRAVISVHDLTTEYLQLDQLRRDRSQLVETKHELERSNERMVSTLELYCSANRELQKQVRERTRAEEELRRKAADLQLAKDREIEHSARLQRLVDEVTDARQQAEGATRAKSAFLANMSHEIRTPMTAILGYVELLRDPSLPKPEVHEAIDAVTRNGEHLLAIINDILDISKIESGGFTTERVASSPRLLVRDAVDLLRGKAKAKGILLTADMPNDVPESVLTDPTRFRQILLNLVGNAVKFTDHGNVRVSVRWTAGAGPLGTLKVDVHDTGIGIPAEALEHLFQPFSQADSSMSRRFGGTGLGLFISKRLAQILGGDLSADSQPGLGSVFSFMLPCETAATAAGAGLDRPSPRTTPGDKPLEGLHLLIAEDQPDNRKLLSYVVAKAGGTCVFAENGDQALDEVLKGALTKPFDLVLMDMEMPVRDGFSAVRTLRERRYSGPIIALTAYAQTEDRERCLAAGCDDYLTKPLERARFVQTCRKWASIRKGTHGVGAATNGTPSFNLDELLTRIDGDLALLGDLRECFRASAPGILKTTELAYAAGDLDGAARSAHALAGTAMVFGADSALKTVRDFERQCRQGNISAADAHWTALTSEFSRLSESLDALPLDAPTR